MFIHIQYISVFICCEILLNISTAQTDQWAQFSFRAFKALECLLWVVCEGLYWCPYHLCHQSDQLSSSRSHQGQGHHSDCWLAGDGKKYSINCFSLAFNRLLPPSFAQNIYLGVMLRTSESNFIIEWVCCQGRGILKLVTQPFGPWHWIRIYQETLLGCLWQLARKNLLIISVHEHSCN